jgi:hypothetical protein
MVATVPEVLYCIVLFVFLVVVLSVGATATAGFIVYWSAAVLFAAEIFFSSGVSLDTFYRRSPDQTQAEFAKARRAQHLAAAALSLILLSNPVVVSVQYATVVRSADPAGDIYPFAWWILLQAAYFVFLSTYTAACLKLQRTGGTAACSAFCCSTRDWIVLSVIFAAFVQVSALIVVTTEYVDGNPLFPVWLVVFQSVWTAWAVVYDWIVHLAVCSCCGADHWSVVINDRGRLAPDEDLSLQLL